MPILRREQNMPVPDTDGDCKLPQSQGSRPRDLSSQGHRKLVRTADGTWAVERSQELQSTQAPSDAFKNSSPPHEIGGYTSDSNLPSMMNTDSSPAHLPDYGNYHSTTISATDNGSPSTSAIVDNQHETIQPGELIFRSTPPAPTGFDSGQISEISELNGMNFNQEDDNEELSGPSMLNNNPQSDAENESYGEKEDEDPSYQPSETESRPGASQTTVSSAKKKKKGKNPRVLQAEVRQLGRLPKTTASRVAVRRSPSSTKANPDPGSKLPSSQHVRGKDTGVSVPSTHNVAKRLYEKRVVGAHSEEMALETQAEQPLAKTTTRRVAKRPYFESETFAEDPQNKSVPSKCNDVKISSVQEGQNQKTDHVNDRQRHLPRTEPLNTGASDLWDMERSPEPPTIAQNGERTRVATKSRTKKPKAKSKQNNAAKRKGGSGPKSHPRFDTNTADPIEDSAMEEAQAEPPRKKQTLVQKMRMNDRTTIASSSKKLVSKTTPPTVSSQTKRKSPIEQAGSKPKNTNSPKFATCNSEKSTPSKGEPPKEEKLMPRIIHFDPQADVVAPQPQDSDNQLELTEKQPENVDITLEEADVTEAAGDCQLIVPNGEVIDDNIKSNTCHSLGNDVSLDASVHVEAAKKETLAPGHLPFRKRGEHPNNRKGIDGKGKPDQCNEFEKNRRTGDEDSTKAANVAACKRPRIGTREDDDHVAKKSQALEDMTKSSMNLPSHNLKKMEYTVPQSNRKASLLDMGSHTLPSADAESQAIDKNSTSTASLRKKENTIQELNYIVPPTIMEKETQKADRQAEDGPFASSHAVPTYSKAHRDDQPSRVFMKPSASKLGAKSHPEYGAHQDVAPHQSLYMQLQGAYDQDPVHAGFAKGDYLPHPRFNNHNGNYNSRKLPSLSDDIFLTDGINAEQHSSSFMSKLKPNSQAHDESQVPILHQRYHLSNRQVHNAQASHRSPVGGSRNDESTKFGYIGIPQELLVNHNVSFMPQIKGRERGNTSVLNGDKPSDFSQPLHPRSHQFGQELTEINHLTETHADNIHPAITSNTGLPEYCRETRSCNENQQDRASASDLTIQQNIRRRWQEAVDAASNSLAESMHNINIMLLNHLLSKEESINNIVDEYKGNGQKIARNLLQRQKKELDNANVAFRKDCREIFIAYGAASKTTRDLRNNILTKSKAVEALATEKRQHLRTARAAINATKEELKTI